MSHLPNRRLFLTPQQFSANNAEIEGQDHSHITTVLRMKVGEKLIVLNNLGTGFLAEIEKIERHSTLARLLEPIKLPPEPPLTIRLGQALCREDKLNQIIQHSVEAGVTSLAPVHTERSLVNADAGKLQEKTTRWRQIARSAAEQSFRPTIPQVDVPVLYRNLLGSAAEDRKFLLHTESTCIPLHQALEDVTLENKLLILVGPEGGWSRQEVKIAQEHGCRLVGLGPRILRTETAALVALSQILYKYEQRS